MMLRPRRFTRCVLSAVIALACCGCGDWTVSPINPPSPTPIKRDANAAKCLDEYGKSLAKVFRDSAAEFDNPDANQVDVAARMGDAQKAARIEAFAPLMERLDEADGSSYETRERLLEFAAELESRR